MPWITKNEHVLQRAARDPQQEESDLERDEFCPEAPAPSNDKETCPGGGRWKMEDIQRSHRRSRTNEEIVQFVYFLALTAI
jgi:hypothetical protein